MKVKNILFKKINSESGNYYLELKVLYEDNTDNQFWIQIDELSYNSFLEIFKFEPPFKNYKDLEYIYNGQTFKKSDIVGDINIKISSGKKRYNYKMQISKNLMANIIWIKKEMTKEGFNNNLIYNTDTPHKITQDNQITTT